MEFSLTQSNDSKVVGMFQSNYHEKFNIYTYIIQLSPIIYQYLPFSYITINKILENITQITVKSFKV